MVLARKLLIRVMALTLGGALGSTAIAQTVTSLGDCATPKLVTFTLNAAFTRLAQCNLDVRAALQGIEGARADIITAGQKPNPTLTVGVGSISFSNGLGSGGITQKQVDTQARIDQTIERGNKAPLRIAAAERGVDVTRWTAAEALRQQQLSLAASWVDAWVAQERVKLAQNVVALYNRTSDASEKRLKAGDIAPNDLARIGLEALRVQGDLAQAEAEAKRAALSLAALLNVPSSALGEIKEAWQAAAAAESSRSDSLARIRPDIRAAAAQSDAADAQRAVAKSQQTRDVSVGVQIDRYPSPAGQGNTLGVFVSVPLFTNHRNEGGVARAEADYTQAYVNFIKVVSGARAEESRALNERQAQALRVTRMQGQTLPLAEKLAANAELAYQKGAMGVLDLLDALRQLRQTQLDALAARADFDKADAAWRGARNDVAALDDPLFGSAYRLAVTP